jgi:hypothetical protein
MFSFEKGTPVARIFGGEDGGRMLFIETNTNREEYSDSESDSDSESLGKTYHCDGRMEERLKIDSRATVYICGPSGSGKTEKALQLISPYCKIFPEKKFYLFSRTDHTKDPAYKKYGLNPIQINIDEGLLENPIDITTELKGGCIILFDDCATLQNDKLRYAIDKLVMDILEIGRKLNITTIITSHLITGNDRKVSKVILNECQKWVLFPKSGSVGQARYALKTHMGLDNKQIDKIMNAKSRSVTINKEYPMYVLTEKIAYIL